MYIRKTIIASAVALVLASTSSVMAEKSQIGEQLPIESMPMIEKSPGGFFVGAPIINNMTVMIVRVFNSQGEQVLNVRSNGEPVELLAANMPDGEYHYQVKTIYQLAIPTGSGPEFTNEGMSSDSGSFYIHDNEVIHTDLNQKNQMSEELGFIDTVRNSALTSIGRALHSLIPAAAAASVSSSPDGDFFLEDDSPEFTIFHDNNITSSTGRVQWWRWNYYDTDGIGNDTQGIELVDRVNNNVVIDVQGGTGTDDSIQIFANGDISWAGQSMFLDKSTDELALGSNQTPAQLSLFDVAPDIRFHDETDSAEVELQLNSGLFTLITRPTTSDVFTNPISIDVNAPTNSLGIASNGDVTLGTGFRFFQIGSDSALHIGGNTDPGFNSLLVSSTDSPEVFLNWPGVAGVELEVRQTGGQRFRINMDTDGDAVADTFDVLRIEITAPENSLAIDGDGNVGFGTSSPSQPIHVQRSDGTASVLVEETNGTAAPRTLFQISNNGNTKFGVNNTEANVEWAFANPGTSFRLSRQGSGVVEMEIRNNGNVVIEGNLTQNSDVNAKTAITAIDADKILAQVASLDIKKWEYKDARGEPHIGPMAQDFYYTFNLGGTATGISTIDTAGVALVAIKALSKENQQLKAAHRQLLAAYHAQQETLDKVDQLEQMVNQLMQSQEGKSIYTSLK